MSALRLVKDFIRALEPVESVIRRESLARLAFPPRRTHLDALKDCAGTHAGRPEWAHHLGVQSALEAMQAPRVPVPPAA